jgi:salicylate synthase
MPYLLYEKGAQIHFAAGEAVVLTLDGEGLHLTTAQGQRHQPLSENPLSQIHTALAELSVADGIAASGWRAYGWAAFEFSALIHRLPLPPDAGTLLYLMIPRHEVTLSEGEAALSATDPALAARWEQALRTASPDISPHRMAVDEITDHSNYQQMAAEAITQIDGTVFRKVILSRSVPLSTPVDLVQTYQALRRGNSPARSFLLNLGGIAAAGVSPQAILEVSPEGRLTTQPLAGTRALTGQPDQDAALQQELLSDPKEIYEHALSVKLAQEEIQAVSPAGAVTVTDFMDVVLRGSVQHMASRVNGQLRDGAQCWDAFGSAFPSVTASGIPKQRACREIMAREQSRRGIYSGAVLMLDSQGAFDAALVLRSVYHKDGRSWLRAGAGLISQSIAERELEETREKLRSVSRFLVPAAGVKG